MDCIIKTVSEAWALVDCPQSGKSEGFYMFGFLKWKENEIMAENEMKVKRFMLLIYAPRGAYNIHRGNGIRNILLNQAETGGPHVLIPIPADIIFSLVSSASEEDAKKAVLGQFDCKPGYYKPYIGRMFDNNNDAILNKDVEKCFEEKISEGKEILQ